MSNWHVLYTNKGLYSVGMWRGDNKVYITIDEPEDTIGQDTEVELSIEVLEEILTQAKTYEMEPSEGPTIMGIRVKCPWK